MKHIKKYFILLSFVLGACKMSFGMDDQTLHLLQAKRLIKSARFKREAPLIYAICEDVDMKILEVLLCRLRLSRRINEADEFGRTPLHLLCRLNEIEKAKLFLQEGAQVGINMADENGRTALYWAHRSACSRMINLLLTRGAREDSRLEMNYKRAKLFFAMKHGNVQMARSILQRENKETAKKLINTTYKDEESLLNFAVYDEEMFRLLLHWGVGLNDSLAFFSACEADNLPVVKLFIEKCEKGVLKKIINCRHEDGKTPLGAACDNNNVAMATLLLLHGANAKNGKVFFDVCKNDNDIEIVKLLLRYGAQRCVNVRCKSTKLTPICFACDNNNFELVKLLLQNGAQKTINVKSLDDETPLDYACKYDNCPMFELLLFNGAHLNDRMFYMTDNQTIKNYFNLLKQFISSEDQMSFIKDKIKKEDEASAQWLAKYAFAVSVHKTLSGKQNIESTLFAKIYRCCNAKFLEKTFNTRTNSLQAVWGYAKRAIAKNCFYFNRKAISQYDFHRRLQAIQKKSVFSDVVLRPFDPFLRQGPGFAKASNFAKASSDRSLGRQDDRGVLGKRKRAERLGPNKKQKRENNRNCQLNFSGDFYD